MTRGESPEKRPERRGEARGAREVEQGGVGYVLKPVGEEYDDATTKKEQLEEAEGPAESAPKHTLRVL